MQESRLRWSCKEEEEVCNLALHLSLTGRRSRGKLKTRWKDVVLKDMSECQVLDEDGEDRAKWKKLIRKADSTTIWDTS
ncbi:hypothetical protein RR48_04618 [Papilio machaon]|uniref:Uncharacterized protein n=1 Tax=Papilio machaon TaxID=76193 RepID=A0A0N1IH79_PAPMA|nr:hypothetical protein RR48_04618 [Papilio machaon]